MSETRTPRGHDGRPALGRRGEDLAAQRLTDQGYAILARNWRCTLGEIDIVALEVSGGRRILVFCEVKCRSGLGYGDPLEAITWRKLSKLRQLAAHWTSVERVPHDDLRIDAIGVVTSRDAPPRVQHVKAVGG